MFDAKVSINAFDCADGGMLCHSADVLVMFDALAGYMLPANGGRMCIRCFNDVAMSQLWSLSRATGPMCGRGM